MLPWVFYIIMAMPSYAGTDKDNPVPVKVTVEVADQITCRKFQEFITKVMKDQGVKFIPTECIAKPSREAK